MKLLYFYNMFFYWISFFLLLFACLLLQFDKCELYAFQFIEGNGGWFRLELTFDLFPLQSGYIGKSLSCETR